MTVFVDEQRAWGWKMHGREVQSCHMFSDQVDLSELHALAQSIGLKRAWFQDKKTAPHYDLVPSKRIAAVAAGVVAVSCREASGLWRARREALAAAPLPLTPAPASIPNSKFSQPPQQSLFS